MTANTNPILDRIKKLLRLAKSANRHEAELALSRAMQLASKHSVDLSKVNPDDDQYALGHDYTRAWARLPFEAQKAATIIQRFFNLKPIISYCDQGERFTFVGTRMHIEIGIYVFNFLVGHFRRCWNKRSNRRLRNRKAFIDGMHHGLWSKLLEAEEKRPEAEENALAVSTGTYISEHIGALTERRSRSKTSKAAKASLLAGYFAGRNTEINPAIRKDTLTLRG